MAPKPSPRAIYEALLDKFDAEIARAFFAAIENLQDASDLGRVIRAISAGNLVEAIAALHLDPAAFADLTATLARAYEAGGQAAVDSMPVMRDARGARFVIRFDGTNPRAAAWLQAHSAELVEAIVSDQRTAMRTILADGLTKGQNPRTTALDIIGRLDRTTGKRVGGVIGLSSNMVDFVMSARAELASADPAQLRNYLTRKRRDKRFDPSIKAAIMDGKPVPADIAAKAAGRYADRLLQLRGQNIARTETLPVLNAAQDEAFEQAIDKGAITSAQVRNTWRSAGDSRVRDTHRALNGETVGQGEYFTSPSGARMRFPGDVSLGAPPGEIINCRCWLQKRVDFLANIR